MSCLHGCTHNTVQMWDTDEAETTWQHAANLRNEIFEESARCDIVRQDEKWACKVGSEARCRTRCGDGKLNKMFGERSWSKWIMRDPEDSILRRGGGGKTKRATKKQVTWKLYSSIRITFDRLIESNAFCLTTLQQCYMCVLATLCKWEKDYDWLTDLVPCNRPNASSMIATYMHGEGRNTLWFKSWTWQVRPKLIWMRTTQYTWFDGTCVHIC